ncbi:MAG: hypothetical protein U0U67_09755 [Chitinophagales bacterium]
MKSILHKIFSLFSFEEIKTELKISDQYLWFGSVLLVFIGIYTVYDLQKYADILFWDESLYMQKGLQLWKNPSLDWGPLYNVWYKFLSFFTDDKIELYYLNYKILCILLPLILFIFLMVYNIHPILSFYVSILFLYSFINIPIWPKVSHWCLIVFLSSIIVSRFLRSVYLKFLCVAIGLVLCSYCRPEFYLAYLLFSTCTILHLILYKKQYVLLKSVFYAIVLFGLYICVQFVGNPIKAGGNGRMLITFGQHFAFNFCRWNHISDKPFWIDWVFYLQENFQHQSKSVILSNISHHFLSNIFNYIKSVLKIITSFAFPLFHSKVNIHSIILTIISIGVLIKFSTIKKENLSAIKSTFRSFSGLLKILLIWCIPTFISSMIAYPRDHYLILQIPFYLLLFVIIVNTLLKIELNIKLFFIIALLLLFAKPFANSFDYFNLLRKEKSLCNFTTANYLIQHYKQKEVNVFDFEGNINSLLPDNFTANSVDFFTSQSTSVSRYIDSAKTDIVYITPSLLHSKFTENDTTLKKWLSSPEKYGFTKIKTGNFDAYLLSKIH